jgi:hypothetical protein
LQVWHYHSSMWHFGGADIEERKRVAPARGVTHLWLHACAYNEEQDFMSMRPGRWPAGGLRITIGVLPLLVDHRPSREGHRVIEQLPDPFHVDFYLTDSCRTLSGPLRCRIGWHGLEAIRCSSANLKRRLCVHAGHLLPPDTDANQACQI